MNDMKKILVGFLILTALLCSCGKTEQKNKFSAHSFDYFDTVTVITGYADSREEFDEISAFILDELAQYHRLYTIYHRFEGLENLCTLNASASDTPQAVTVDGRIIDMLVFAKKAYELSGGTVNVAMGSVLSLWHDYRTVGIELPPMDTLLLASEHTDIQKLIIDEENCAVALSDAKMRLDVGALAKGYAVERIARELSERGVEGYVLNVGGNVRTIGQKPSGEGFIVGIENPQNTDGEYLAYLELRGESVVTSGSYQRYYTVDGEHYHHIIDPQTLMPAKGYLSVSVICNDSGLGDALSTALFCMSVEQGLDILETVPGAEALWVCDDGTKIYSPGFDRYTKK